MSRVFVTSNRMRKDHATGTLKPIFDLRPAEQYGSLNAVFDHDMEPTNTADVHRASDRVDDFDPDSDYVLPNGSPLATLATGMILRDKGIDTVQTLVWDKIYMKYVLGVIEL
jgi:hypothetical protein